MAEVSKTVPASDNRASDNRVITKFVATDKPTGNYVFVAGGVYSVNGTEPIEIPEDMREMDARMIAREMLRRLLAKDAPR